MIDGVDVLSCKYLCLFGWMWICVLVYLIDSSTSLVISIVLIVLGMLFLC